MDKRLDYDHYYSITDRTYNRTQIRISYLRAMKKHSANGSLNLRFARFLADEKSYKQAEFRYKKASILKPSEKSIYNSWGLMLDKQGKLEGQEELFRKVIELGETCVEGYCNLGAVLTEKGRIEEAIVIFEKALSHSPNHIMSLNNVASIYLDLGKYDKAVGILQNVIDLNKNLFLPYINLGLAYSCLQRSDEAKENYTKAFALIGENCDQKEWTLRGCERLLGKAKDNLLKEGNGDEERSHHEKFRKALEEVISLVNMIGK